MDQIALGYEETTKQKKKQLCWEGGVPNKAQQHGSIDRLIDGKKEGIRP